MKCKNCHWGNIEEIEFQLLNDDGMIGIPPQRGTEKSSGIDVFIPNGFVRKMTSHVDIPCELPYYYFNYGEDILIPLNLRVNIPEHCDIEVKNKSGIATKLKLIKGAHVIDQDYRGNLKLHLFNLGKEVVKLSDGMKIAQLVVRPVLLPKVRIVESIDINTERGEGGFGSTGDKA